MTTLLLGGFGAAAAVGMPSGPSLGSVGTPALGGAITVAPGDTLWSIAEDVAPTKDPRETVSALRELNGLHSGVLRAGQELFLPPGAD